MTFSVPADVVLLGEMSIALLAAWAARAATRPLRQPAVVAEILAGMALGPSLLGLLPGDLSGHLFPPSGRGTLASVAQIGVVLFMFVVGWELDFSGVRVRRQAATALMVANFAVPFAVGAALAFALYHHDAGVTAGHQVARPVFVIYVGVALAITAFPVLARILDESRMRSTPMGQTAMAVAAGTDLCGWIGVAFVVFAASVTGSAGPAVTMPLVAVYVVVILACVRPALRRFLRRSAALGAAGLLPIIVAGLLLSAYISSALGLHAVFGAFVFGLAMPRDSRALLALQVAEPMEHAGAILMPAYFVVTGLSADFSALGWSGFGLGIGIVVAASLAKGGAVYGAARLAGVDRRDSRVLSVLMNTRGLTEIVVLNIGLSLGIITTRLFTALLLMAVMTTAVTGPILHRLKGSVTGADLEERSERRDVAPTESEGATPSRAVK